MNSSDSICEPDQLKPMDSAEMFPFLQLGITTSLHNATSSTAVKSGEKVKPPSILVSQDLIDISMSQQSFSPIFPQRILQRPLDQVKISPSLPILIAMPSSYT